MINIVDWKSLLFSLNTIFRIYFYQIHPFSDEDEVSAKVQPNQEAEKKKKLINQFNYCERAVLTLNNPPRVNNSQASNILVRNRRQSVFKKNSFIKLYRIQHENLNLFTNCSEFLFTNIEWFHEKPSIHKFRTL